MPKSPEPVSTSSNPRLQALLGHEFFAPHHWKRRLVLWFGAVLVALAAILFAKASVWSYRLFLYILGYGVWIPLILTPVVFGLLSWATEGRLRATRGSGIPQVIGTLHIEDDGFRARMLSLPPAEVMMVAAHPYDLLAAQKQGLRTAYVPRPLEHGPGAKPHSTEGMAFDLTASDFIDLAAKLRAFAA